MKKNKFMYSMSQILRAFAWEKCLIDDGPNAQLVVQSAKEF